MKTLTTILLAHFSLLNACGQTVNTTNSSQSDSGKVEVVSTRLPVRTPPDIDTDRICAHGKCSVKAYVDGKLESVSYYTEGRNSRYLLYDTSTGKLLVEIASVYDENNRLVREKLIRGGKYYDDTPEGQLYRDHLQKESDFQYEKLHREGIFFPMPDLVDDELMDLSTMLYIFKKYQKVPLPEDEENQSMFQLVGLDEDVMFRSARISEFVGDPVYIKNLELTVKNSLPTRATIITENGNLTIKFDYAAGNLKKIEYRFTKNDGSVSSLSREFAYAVL